MRAGVAIDKPTNTTNCSRGFRFFLVPNTQNKIRIGSIRSECTTSTATPRRDEDPELFVELPRGMSCCGTTSYVGHTYFGCRTPNAVCRMPRTRTIGPLTPSLREKMISHQFASLLQQSRICHLPFPFSFSW